MPDKRPLPSNKAGCPISRSFFARCGIPQISMLLGPKADNLGAVVAHISQKTSEIWGTRPPLALYEKEHRDAR